MSSKDKKETRRDKEDIRDMKGWKGSKEDMEDEGKWGNKNSRFQCLHVICQSVFCLTELLLQYGGERGWVRKVERWRAWTKREREWRDWDLFIHWRGDIYWKSDEQESKYGSSACNFCFICTLVGGRENNN